MARAAVPRCPSCNSATVRKREMIVKTGTYDRLGGSTGLFNSSPTRVSASRGRNHWVEELTPSTYLPPSALAFFLSAWAYNPDISVGLGFYIFVAVNGLWFVGVHGEKESFRKEWACSKCGEVWDPSEPEANSEEE